MNKVNKVYKFDQVKANLIKEFYNLLAFKDRKSNEFLEQENRVLQELAKLDHVEEQDEKLVEGLYARFLESCFKEELNIAFKIGEENIAKYFPNFQGELMMDKAVMKACLDGLVILKQDNILSDLFIDYAPFMTTDAFWKTYYGLYQHNTDIAERLKESRCEYIDRAFERFDATKKDAIKVTAERLIEIFIQDSLNNFALNYKSYLMAKNDLENVYEPNIAEQTIFDKLYKVAQNPKRFNQQQILAIYKAIKKYKNADQLNSTLYDMLASAREKAAEKIVRNTNQIITSDKQEKNINGARVIYFDENSKADFLIHTAYYDPANLQGLVDRFKDIGNREKNYVMSMSLIDQNTSGSGYGDVNEKISFGFKNLKPENIAHISPVDSFSLSVKDDRHLSYQPQVWTTPENLKNYSDVYNEINYVCPSKYDDEKLLPDFIVSSRQNPTNDELEVAKLFNIPVICVPEKCYINDFDEEKKREIQEFAKQKYYPEVQKKYEQRGR